MRVLVINDLSCVGKCSLSVALPIISACGVTCDVLPTAILSTHTGGFEGYTFRDLTEDIPDILAHWKTLDVKFDYILSGYLGSIDQIRMVRAVKRDFLKEGGTFVVDPVMGDGGELYDGFSEEYIDVMRELCKEADYILPNATEGAFLAELPYPSIGKETVEKLRSTHTCPILTGVREGNEIAVYTDGESGVERYPLKNVDGFFCGAGDVFASAFVGALARGKTKTEAVRLAADFTTAAISRSAKEVKDKRYGLNFEAEIFSFLQKL